MSTLGNYLKDLINLGTFYVKVDGVTIVTTSKKRVGCGGSKCAYNLTDNLVLVLPSSIREANSYWPGMIDEEVGMSDLLTRNGLLSPKHKKGQVYKSMEDNDLGIPCFISRSFSSLALEGIYVYDLNGQDRYFDDKNGIFVTSNQDLRDTVAWDFILKILLMEIPIMYAYELPDSGDSFNLAIIRSDETSLISPYQIRYFGFDFSSKQGADVNYNRQPRESPSQIQMYIYCFDIIRSAIKIILYEEYDARAGKKLISLSEEGEKILEDLTVHYVDKLSKQYPE
jgi:hypothetical protein